MPLCLKAVPSLNTLQLNLKIAHQRFVNCKANTTVTLTRLDRGLCPSDPDRAGMSVLPAPGNSFEAVDSDPRALQPCAILKMRLTLSFPLAYEKSTRI